MKDERTMTRDDLVAALAKPLAAPGEGPSVEEFDPWEDVIMGVHGSYASEFDYLFIQALEAVRDKQTFDFIKKNGLVGELVIYILSGHGYLEYGTSPRGGWWDHAFEGLLQPLIDKWREHSDRAWGQPHG